LHVGKDQTAARQVAKDAKEFKIKWLTLGAGAATVVISVVTLVFRLLELL
jgi:hypothetical protein